MTFDTGKHLKWPVPRVQLKRLNGDENKIEMSEEIPKQTQLINLEQQIPLVFGTKSSLAI